MNESGPAPVRPGDLLAGKYRVERVIGVGGMGIVVAARHEQLDQLVAIKFVRSEVLATSDAAERFLREARAAVKLRSEHVAKVLDVGKLETGAPYMVMELLDGSDLAHVVATRGPMSVETTAWLLLQACEAVAEAHATGIVHRDLKPQNLFLTTTVGGSPKLKVLDFGVSKAVGMTSGVGALTRTRAVLGSPLYMAPEQMRSSRDVDARVDVWALGVVLFELLTGRWPFEAETMPELCLKVVSDPPTPLSSLRADVPPEFVAVIERCLEKDPSKRFANAAELATALEPFAPPASRLLAERARLVTLAPPMTSRPVHSASAPTLQSPADIPVRPTSIPSGWGKSSASRPTSGRRLAGWSAGALLLMTALAVVVMVSRHGATRSQGSAASGASMTSRPVVDAPAAATAPARQDTLGASPSTAAAGGPAPSSLASAPAASASVPMSRSSPGAAAPPSPTRTYAPARTAAPRSTAVNAGHGPSDDDIPALR